MVRQKCVLWQILRCDREEGKVCEWAEMWQRLKVWLRVEVWQKSDKKKDC